MNKCKTEGCETKVKWNPVTRGHCQECFVAAVEKAKSEK